jgi:hypothetical protein
MNIFVHTIVIVLEMNLHIRLLVSGKTSSNPLLLLWSWCA